MREILHTYYAINVVEEIVIDDKLGYMDDECVYFTISSDNNKAIHMERATLAYYLVEQGYNQTAFPIQNKSGDWMTQIDNNKYMVVKVTDIQQHQMYEHGEVLASFHQRNMSYHYEPQYISSYGQWKQLWIDKLTFFEQHIVNEAKKNPNNFFRLLMDVLPYIIGISENAIQYIQESELDSRYDISDQGTISFHRYYDHLLKPMIMPTDLVYDHLTRDVAEYVRNNLVYQDNLESILDFLTDYESIQPLSVFSWRLLYARLLFPIHLFDFIADVLISKRFDEGLDTLENVLKEQETYEKNLKNLFSQVKVTSKRVDIPLLHWI